MWPLDRTAAAGGGCGASCGRAGAALLAVASLADWPSGAGHNLIG
jgi:hypothetical protein